MSCKSTVLNTALKFQNKNNNLKISVEGSIFAFYSQWVGFMYLGSDTFPMGPLDVRSSHTISVGRFYRTPTSSIRVSEDMRCSLGG